MASGNFLLAGGEVGALTIDHNTVDQQGTFAVLFKGDVWTAGSTSRRPGRFAVETLTVTNNLANHGLYGVFGEGAGIGTPGLIGLTGSYRWTNNVLAGSAAREYIPCNHLETGDLRIPAAVQCGLLPAHWQQLPEGGDRWPRSRVDRGDRRHVHAGSGPSSAT